MRLVDSMRAKERASRRAGRRPAVLAVAVLVVATSLWGYMLWPRDPLMQNLSSAMRPPSVEHPFGTDQLGRDVLSRVLRGAHVSLVVSLIAIGIASIGGTTLGFVSGFFGGVFDDVIMRVIDGMMAFPGLLLALFAVTILGPGLVTAQIAVGISQMPLIARIARSAVLTEKEKLYVEAGTAVGASSMRVLTRYVAPNSLGPLVVQISLMVADTILVIAGLGFLGLGAQPPTPELGSMLSESRLYMWQAPHLAVFPGIVICGLALTFNALGDVLRRRLSDGER